jgi:hypothetical protein
VYGIANEIDISVDGGLDDYLDISLEIGGFTAPVADYAASLYTWTLSVQRWGSGDIVRQFAGTGP